MHILLEEAPLLVFYFLTLFLSNYKLRLILSIFWTTSTFCQLALTCSLTSFVRYARSSLTHFARSLNARFARLLRIVPSISLATESCIERSEMQTRRSRAVLRNTYLNVHSLFQIRLFNLLYHHFSKFVCAIASFQKFFP